MTALSPLASIVGLIWGTFVVLRGSLVVGCVAYLVLSACFGNFQTIEIGSVSLSFHYWMFGGLVLAFLVQSRLHRTDPKPLCRSDGLLALLLVWLAISAIFQQSKFDGANHGLALGRLMTGFLIPATVYWIARRSPLTRGSIRTIRNTLVCCGLYLVLPGTLELASQGSWSFRQQIVAGRFGLPFRGADVSLLSSESMQILLAVGFLTACVAWPRVSLVSQLILLLSLPLAVAGVYYSVTNIVWIGATVGLVVAWSSTLRGTLRMAVLTPLIAIGSLLAIIHLDRLLELPRQAPWSVLVERLASGDAASPHADVSTPLFGLLMETEVISIVLLLVTCVAWGRNAWILQRSPRAPIWAQQYAALCIAALIVFSCQLLLHRFSFSMLDNTLLFLLAGVTVSLRQEILQSAEFLQPESAMRHPASVSRSSPSRKYLPLGA